MINFVNSFLSYILLMAVIVIVAGIAIFIGIRLRRKKNEEGAALEAGVKEKQAVGTK